MWDILCDWVVVSLLKRVELLRWVKIDFIYLFCVIGCKCDIIPCETLFCNPGKDNVNRKKLV